MEGEKGMPVRIIAELAGAVASLTVIATYISLHLRKRRKLREEAEQLNRERRQKALESPKGEES